MQRCAPTAPTGSIPRGDIEEALGRVPLANTVAVQHLFGPSYIYAVLMGPKESG